MENIKNIVEKSKNNKTTSILQSFYTQQADKFTMAQGVTAGERQSIEGKWKQYYGSERTLKWTEFNEKEHDD